MSNAFMWMLIVCGVIQVAMLVAGGIYVWMVRATRHWLPADGKVITSRVVSRKRREHGDSNTDLTNTPLVEYEYKVNDKSFRGDRIMIAGGISEVELDYVLGRYPLGATVVVYYNPADPQQAVLEREIPAYRLRGCGITLLLPFGVPLAAILIYNYAARWLTAVGAVDWLRAFVAASPYAACFGGVGLAILGYAFILIVMAVRASAWPVTRGRIVSAGVDRISSLDADSTDRFKPSITYAYEVNGRRYGGGRVTVAIPFGSNVSWLSRRTLAKYPVGTDVDVHYNPKNPRESVLHPWSGHVVRLLIAAGFLAVAWAMAGPQQVK
jgi:hypothetical protein